MAVDSSTQVTPSPSIVLPQPRTEERARPARTRFRLDAVLVVLLLGFAFLLGSAPARNSDLWMHLSAGKLLLSGDYHFGVDPFAHTTRNAYWANPAWLFDVLTYLLYSAFGGASLVVLKAVLLVLIAGVLLRTSANEGGLLAPILCTALTVLAVSRWLLVQPIAFSYLFLALTVWFLERPRGRAASWTAYWPLLPLFVLWVNMDDWFLLGPLTVALYLLGAVLDGARSEWRRLGLVLVLGTVACVLNPHHIHAFALPWQLGLSEAGSVLWEQPQFRGLFLSPRSWLFYRPDAGLNPAGVAYFVLLALSPVAFVLNWREQRWGRMLLWTAMLALSVISARAIPFFAVVAGPLIAVNLQEWLVRRAADSVRRPWQTAGRLLAVLAGFLLLAAAWPGWLQQPPYEPRRLNVEADASLERVGRQLAEWRQSGALPPDARGFNFSLEAANYLAFHSPGEKNFLDQRLALFSRKAAGDFLAVRQSLAGSPESEREISGQADWRAILRKWDVNFVVLHDADLGRSTRLFRRMMANTREWTPLLIDGRTAVFGWRDGQRLDGKFDALALDLRRRAFQPRQEERAPRQWPGRDPEPRTWWDAFTRPAAGRSPETDEATFYLNIFDDLKPRYFAEHLNIWNNAQISTLLAGLSCGDAALTGPLGQSVRTGLTGLFLLNPRPMEASPSWKPTRMQLNGLQLMNMYFLQHDDAPMHLPLLAIRAARRAIHANPDDAYAYLTLGEAYMRLSRETRERLATSGQRMEYLKRIRQLQAITAFNHALTLNPELAQAHFHLANLYTDLRMADLVLKHRREQARLSRAAGPRPGESAEQFKERQAQLDEQVDQLDTDVRELLTVYEVNSQNLKVGERAHMANTRGLGGKALEILLASDITAFQEQGLELELTLLLSTGRIREFRTWFAPEHKESLGGYAYQWFAIYLAAASGDYAEADRQLAELEPPESFRGRVVEGIGQAVLDGQSSRQGIPSIFITRHAWEQMLARLDRWTLQQYHRADLIVVRGLLALEQGDTDHAAALFRQALAAAQAATPTGKAEFSGRMLAEACLEMLAP